MQKLLFDTGQLTNGFRDSSFARNKSLPLHRWVPWVAGFSAEFVGDCLERFLPSPKGVRWVLDPFAGVGTTLVEAFTRGYNAAGFEVNPYAALASKSKLEALKVSTKKLDRTIIDFGTFMAKRDISARSPESQPPPGFSGRTQLFSPPVERKVLYALDFINSVTDARIRNLFRIALGSVMVSMSNYTYEPSLTRRSSVGKANVEDAAVGEVIGGKLRLMLDDMEWLKGKMKSFPSSPKVCMHRGSIFSAIEVLGRGGFVDLVVTSPPYLNNYHYPRNTRPQLHWLGLASGTGYNGSGQEHSFGKFWQAVRDLPPVKLSFRHRMLDEILTSVRQRNPEKKNYGGPGWANYVATYFNDTYRFCELLSSLLRPDGVAVIVLGNSIIQGVEVKTDHFFGKIAEKCGLGFEDTILLRKKRTGTSITQSSVRVAASKTILYESAIILRK